MSPTATAPTTAPAQPLDLAWQARVQNHGLTVRFYRPTHTLPVSLTGEHCGLDCAHCGGHYLQHMHPIEHASTADVRSCLISGGCDARGRVPVNAHLAQVAALHATLRMNWHVGMIDEDTMRHIAPHVDAVSFDMVGDADTSREVYGLDYSLHDYVNELVMLRRHARVVPHLTLGLRGGIISGEYHALDALAVLQTETLILNILIPTPGTRYAECSPPTLGEVEQLFATARLAMPESRLILGCMRPRGDYRQAVDELAVRVGLNGIVNPTQRALRTATELGLSIEWGDECCAL